MSGDEPSVHLGLIDISKALLHPHLPYCHLIFYMGLCDDTY